MTDFFGKLKSGAGKVAFEADKMSRVNRAQGELSQIKHQIETQFSKLGQLHYQLFLNPESESPDFTEIYQHIHTLEQQMGIKAEEIQRIYAETYTPTGSPAPAPAPTASVNAAPVPFAPAAAPAQEEMPEPLETSPAPVLQGVTKTCPNCGREMAAAAKFCPDCGVKM